MATQSRSAAVISSSTQTKGRPSAQATEGPGLPVQRRRQLVLVGPVHLRQRGQAQPGREAHVRVLHPGRRPHQLAVAARRAVAPSAGSTRLSSGWPTASRGTAKRARYDGYGRAHPNGISVPSMSRKRSIRNRIDDRRTGAVMTKADQPLESLPRKDLVDTRPMRRLPRVQVLPGLLREPRPGRGEHLGPPGGRYGDDALPRRPHDIAGVDPYATARHRLAQRPYGLLGARDRDHAPAEHREPGRPHLGR